MIVEKGKEENKIKQGFVEVLGMIKDVCWNQHSLPKPKGRIHHNSQQKGFDTRYTKKRNYQQNTDSVGRASYLSQRSN